MRSMILCLTFGGQTTGVFAYTEAAARGRLLRYADMNQTYGQRGASHNGFNSQLEIKDNILIGGRFFLYIDQLSC